MAHDMPQLTRRHVLGSGAAISAAAIAGCFGGDDDDDSFIHITQSQERDEDFDPVIANDAYSAQVYQLVYDGLYEFGEGLELEPNVATDFPDVENDGTRYLFEIHEGIEFHNGDELTASDVAHSFTAPVEEDTENASSYNMIEDIEIIDDHQLQVDLFDPYGPFELQTMAVTIVNEDVRTDDPEDYNTNPVGSGPYTWGDWSANEFAEVELWDDYWDDDLELNIDTVRFEAHADEAGRISDIDAGNTDVAMDIPNADWEDLDANDDVTVTGAESPTYMYMAFNCNEGPTTNPEVRRAICHAFSMQDFIETHAEHVASPMYSPVPPVVNEVWGFPEDEYRDMLPEYDPDEAEALLDEHAPDDFEPTIIAPEGLRAQLAERIATRLDEIGYGADAQILSFDALVDTYVTGEYEDYAMYFLGWTGGPDPDYYLYPLFHESQEEVNQGHFYEGSDGFHDAIAEGRETADQDERYDIYEPVIREIVEELPALPAFTQDNTMAIGQYVDGLEAHPNVASNPNLASKHYDVSVE
ncbi:ABC transporter substrate-binding protein [Halovivax gelatinilyticus]|uniref:ABC transporter substrate-binding protein n=1 Tax=Halovivax gelatinilyticus TaxID=2961597 RepID=UPI0020CA4964|nr:ABC transporter substrate-binding protein [Halovivax gelatinilyticus]